MALTDAQMAAVRRYAGYPLSGLTIAVTDDWDTVYTTFGVVQMSFHRRLTSLSAVEESILITQYLTPLATLETDIPAAAQNLDTDVAAVWTHNKREVNDRVALFNRWRREMCSFLGMAPGPGIGTGVMQLVRA